MKIALYFFTLVAAIFGAHRYYDFLLASERLHKIIESYGSAGYWGALLLPGIIAGLVFFWLVLARLKIKLLASIIGGCLVIAAGLFGSTAWCIFRGIGSCI